MPTSSKEGLTMNCASEEGACGLLCFSCLILYSCKGGQHVHCSCVPIWLAGWLS